MRRRAAVAGVPRGLGSERLAVNGRTSAVDMHRAIGMTSASRARVAARLSGSPPARDGDQLRLGRRPALAAVALSARDCPPVCARHCSSCPSLLACRSLLARRVAARADLEAEDGHSASVSAGVLIVLARGPWLECRALTPSATRRVPRVRCRVLRAARHLPSGGCRVASGGCRVSRAMCRAASVACRALRAVVGWSRGRAGLRDGMRLGCVT